VVEMQWVDHGDAVGGSNAGGGVNAFSN